jgi:hypothetical protein
MLDSRSATVMGRRNYLMLSQGAARRHAGATLQCPQARALIGVVKAGTNS